MLTAPLYAFQIEIELDVEAQNLLHVLHRGVWNYQGAWYNVKQRVNYLKCKQGTTTFPSRTFLFSSKKLIKPFDANQRLIQMFGFSISVTVVLYVTILFEYIFELTIDIGTVVSTTWIMPVSKAILNDMSQLLILIQWTQKKVGHFKKSWTSTHK